MGYKSAIFDTIMALCVLAKCFSGASSTSEAITRLSWKLFKLFLPDLVSVDGEFKLGGFLWYMVFAFIIKCCVQGGRELYQQWIFLYRLVLIYLALELPAPCQGLFGWMCFICMIFQTFAFLHNRGWLPYQNPREIGVIELWILVIAGVYLLFFQKGDDWRDWLLDVYYYIRHPGENRTRTWVVDRPPQTPKYSPPTPRKNVFAIPN
jgi:hypothetical protein